MVAHNIDEPLPALGKFDAMISSFAIHHLVHERKRALYTEIFELAESGGVFCNLEHVARRLSRACMRNFWSGSGLRLRPRIHRTSYWMSKHSSDGCARLDSEDVDCAWKWRELALLVGRRG